MDTSNHCTMATLFSQLGLDSDAKSIETFVTSHRLQPSQRIEEASFWNASQATFIKEARDQDADWAELVD
ncbi:MAG: DUF2789 domain-containing protein, partial [Bermanella sp.]